MTAASYKFDDGQSCPTKCFPARTLTLTLLRRRKEGAGHWLVAYRQAEEQKYRNVHRRIKQKESEQHRVTDTHGGTLDGPFLLQLHCVNKPSELCYVNISEQSLNSVKPEDLKVFDNVAYVDASINSLSLGSFSSFGSLRELNLSLNGICSLMVNATDFPHLEVLNMSYNYLSSDDFVSIGQLPRLKVLHLTGNQLHHLDSSSHDPTQLPDPEEDTQFRALEVLMLDDNRLSSGVFSSLKNLKRLKYLNLQGNRISEIPYLQLTGYSKPVHTNVEEQTKEDGPAQSDSSFNTDDKLKMILKIFHRENWEEYWKGSSFPLPELQFLNLSDNKIAEEEALMAVALFPMLREIDIHSNPLTTQRSGDPPLLTNYLQGRLGITITRKKTHDTVKLPQKVAKWKVSKRKAAMRRTADSEGNKNRDDTFQENTQHFFLTQATDVSENESEHQADAIDPEEKKDRKEDDSIPEKSNFYKMLMDVKLNPDVVEPIGIQTAVRMLEHTLKNLNVYRDVKPKFDSIQTPYRERAKRIKELPPVKPMKQRTERVDEIIKEIKESTTIREVALSSAIHGTGVNKQEYKEALLLLKDMKTQYKMVHKKTMEQEACIKSD